MITLREVTNNAIRELEEYLDHMSPDELRNIVEQDDPLDRLHDLIHEVANSNVPIYYADILEVAIDDIHIATNEPEIPAFNGSPTPINIIAANIFEAVENALWEWWADNKDSLLDE